VLLNAKIFLFLCPLVVFCRIVALQSSPVDAYYHANLSQEEQALKTVFFRAVGMSELDWQKALEQAYVAYDEDEISIKKQSEKFPTPSFEIKQSIAKLMREQCLIPESVQVLGNKSGLVLRAFKSIILVADDFFKKYNATQDEIEAVLLHEIIHISKLDEVELLALKMIYDNLPWYTKLRVAPLLQRWKLFREKRADILAGLTSPARAYALASFYIKVLNSPYYLPSDPTHPPLHKRIEYMKALGDSLQKGSIDQPSRLAKGIDFIKGALGYIQDYAVGP